MAGGMGVGAMANNFLHPHSGGVAGGNTADGDASGGDASGGGHNTVDPTAGSTHSGQVWRSEVGDATVHAMPDGSHVYHAQNGDIRRSTKGFDGSPRWQLWNGTGWGGRHLDPKLIPRR